MKRIATLAAFLLFTFNLLNAAPVKIHISSVKEDRSVSNFNGVASSGVVNVIIKMGDTESLRLEGDADAIADLITEVKGNILNIRPKTKVYWNNKFRNAKVTAYITAKNINSLTMSGSAEMRVENAFTTNSLTTTLSGSGSIKAKATVKSFVGVISGSGTINVAGSADNANITLSGSGNFSGKDFSIEKLSTQVSGSGDVDVKVSDRISAVISGSGDVNYTGDASHIDKTTIGSGRVRRV